MGMEVDAFSLSLPRAVWGGQLSWQQRGGQVRFGDARVVAAPAAGGDLWLGAIQVRFEEGEAMENPTPWKRQAIAVLPAPTNL